MTKNCAIEYTRLCFNSSFDKGVALTAFWKTVIY